MAKQTINKRTSLIISQSFRFWRDDNSPATLNQCVRRLSRLKQHLESSRFILNDLRMLRRLLLGERDATDSIGDAADVPVEAQPPQVSAAP